MRPANTDFTFKSMTGGYIENRLISILGTLDASSDRVIDTCLTLKVPPIICSRRQFQILPLFQKITNKA